MALTDVSDATLNGPAIYRVRVQGSIPRDWSGRLMGMSISMSDDADENQSILVGRLPDQSALSSVLDVLYENQYPILSINRLETG